MYLCHVRWILSIYPYISYNHFKTFKYVSFLQSGFLFSVPPSNSLILLLTMVIPEFISPTVCLINIYLNFQDFYWFFYYPPIFISFLPVLFYNFYSFNWKLFFYLIEHFHFKPIYFENFVGLFYKINFMWNKFIFQFSMCWLLLALDTFLWFGL